MTHHRKHPIIETPRAAVAAAMALGSYAATIAVSAYAGAPIAYLFVACRDDRRVVAHTVVGTDIGIDSFHRRIHGWTDRIGRCFRHLALDSVQITFAAPVALRKSAAPPEQQSPAAGQALRAFERELVLKLAPYASAAGAGGLNVYLHLRQSACTDGTVVVMAGTDPVVVLAIDSTPDNPLREVFAPCKDLLAVLPSWVDGTHEFIIALQLRAVSAHDILALTAEREGLADRAGLTQQDGLEDRGAG
jgi:hypothetical protein